MKAYDKVLKAAETDVSIFTERGKEGETFGHNPAYLSDVHNITKNDLIRLEREGLAVKARYEQRHPQVAIWDAWDEKNPEKPFPRKNGQHRVRWLIFRRSDESKV